MTSLDVCSVAKSFGAINILAGISLSIETGAILGIIGRSGSGKSSLGKILGGLLLPDVGSVSCHGTEITDQAEIMSDSLIEWRRKVVGLVSQQDFFLPWLTVHEQIAFGQRFGGVRRDARTGRSVGELARLLGIEHLLGRKTELLSGGERRRINLARALVMETEFIVLDEVTNGLDPILVNTIGSLIVKLSKELGRGVVLISHQIEFLRKNADRIVFLEQGQILERGGTDILETPRSNELADFLSVVRASY